MHSSSSSHYELLRKSVPFILLPDKRTLFDVNKKAAIPADCFFNTEITSPYCNVLKKLSEIMKTKNHKNEIKKDMSESTNGEEDDDGDGNHEEDN